MCYYILRFQQHSNTILLQIVVMTSDLRLFTVVFFTGIGDSLCDCDAKVLGNWWKSSDYWIRLTSKLLAAASRTQAIDSAFNVSYTVILLQSNMHSIGNCPHFALIGLYPCALLFIDAFHSLCFGTTEWCLCESMKHFSSVAADVINI